MGALALIPCQGGWAPIVGHNPAGPSVHSLDWPAGVWDRVDGSTRSQVRRLVVLDAA